MVTYLALVLIEFAMQSTRDVENRVGSISKMAVHQLVLGLRGGLRSGRAPALETRDSRCGVTSVRRRVMLGAGALEERLGMVSCRIVGQLRDECAGGEGCTGFGGGVG